MAPPKSKLQCSAEELNQRAVNLEGELTMLRAVAAKASVVQALVSEKSAFVASLGSQLALATSELNAAQDTLASLNAPGDSEGWLWG